MRWIALPLAALAACATAPRRPPDPPTCPGDAEVADRARRWLALEPLPNPVGLTAEGAECGQRKLVAALSAKLGKVVGYKAGLTNTSVQQRFGVIEPLRGVLLEKMLLPDGAVVPARFGVHPFLEADLIVEVGSSAIHEATSARQVLASLRAVYPFIELPDVLAQDPTRVDAASIVANDVGARLGVLGKAIPVTADQAFADALREMTVRTTADGQEISTARGAAILGHPLNAVLRLAARLRRDGITLQPGDLLSLGAFYAGPVVPGQEVRVTYQGLPGTPTVAVRFR